MTATLIEKEGVFSEADAEAVRRRVDAGEFFWLDLVGEDPDPASEKLAIMGVEPADVAWASRFGQMGRLHVGRNRLRAVTWCADSEGHLIEIHLIACKAGVATLWKGAPDALDDIRMKFYMRAGGVERDFHLAGGILLQLILGTLDQLLLLLDTYVDDMRLRLDRGLPSAEFASVLPGLQKLQSFSAGFSRFSSATRSATVGIEAVAGVTARAAEELNDYAEQVEDFEEQLFERRRWASDLTHDWSTRIAEAQGAQIDRLTLVSMIFLPLTAITGFFGMNFDWMTEALSGFAPFVIFGLLLPAASVGGVILLLWRKGLIRPGRRN